MIFEVVRIITFLLEIWWHLYICISNLRKYQRSDFACMNIGEEIFLKPSVITSLPEICRYTCSCISHIHMFRVFLFIGCLNKSVFDTNIRSSFKSEVIARSMMYDSTSENKEKYGQILRKIDIFKAPIFSTFKLL